MSARSLEDHLMAAEGTLRFAAHARQLQRLQRAFESALTPALRPHARIANLRQGKLVIHAANGAVAAKLRQIVPRFVDLLQLEAAKLTEIEVRVQAVAGTARRSPHPRPRLPEEKTQRGLADLEDSLPEESPLKAPLQRLLQTLRSR